MDGTQEGVLKQQEACRAVATAGWAAGLCLLTRARASGSVCIGALPRGKCGDGCPPKNETDRCQRRRGAVTLPRSVATVARKWGLSCAARACGPVAGWRIWRLSVSILPRAHGTVVGAAASIGADLGSRKGTARKARLPCGRRRKVARVVLSSLAATSQPSCSLAGSLRGPHNRARCELSAKCPRPPHHARRRCCPCPPTGTPKGAAAASATLPLQAQPSCGDRCRP
jgi:hypothetical protein